jgi:hypothetical protein
MALGVKMTSGHWRVMATGSNASTNRPCSRYTARLRQEAVSRGECDGWMNNPLGIFGWNSPMTTLTAAGISSSRRAISNVSAMVMGLVAVVATLGMLAFTASPRAWTLETDFGAMRVISVETADGPQVFYYMTYKATNRTGRDLVFAPSFELVQGDGTVITAGRGVPAGLSKTLIERLSNPLLQDQISIIGTIQHGSDNAKEGLVIFPAVSLRPGAITVYAAGFSGETKLIRLPGQSDERGRPVFATLRKSRELKYADPGDLTNRRDLPLDLAEANWLMR